MPKPEDEIDVARMARFIESDHIKNLDDHDLQALLTQTRRCLVMGLEEGKPQWLMDAWGLRESLCSKELDWRRKAQMRGGPSYAPTRFKERIVKVKLEKSIAEVVALSGVELKHAGHDTYKGRCPFHEEKTPSFTCWQDTNRWRCFGCSQGGDVLDYVMAWRGIEMRDALEFLEGRSTEDGNGTPSPAGREAANK